MSAWRRFTFTIALTAALAVLILAVTMLWNAHQWDYLPAAVAESSDASALQQKVEIYNRRVNDLQLLVILLLGVCGLYTIVFVLAAHFSSLSFGRHADRAVAQIKDQLGLAMGDLRELKEDTRAELDRMPREVSAEASPPNLQPNLAELEKRLASLAGQRLGEDEMQELVHAETAAPAIELLASPGSASTLAGIYRSLGVLYASRDSARARFYLQRAIALAPGNFEVENELGMLALQRRPPAINEARHHFEASLRVEPKQQRARYGVALADRAEYRPEAAERGFTEALAHENWETAPDPERRAYIHYDLACLLAARAAADPAQASVLFGRAADELQAAFTYPSRELEQRLARDTEEEGCLYDLANSDQFGPVVDNLLLKMRVESA
jgi:hypothetical protein